MADSSEAPVTNGPHPLQFKWTLWHDVTQKTKGTYAANLREVASFDTVEDFWALFNNLKQPSHLSFNNNYNLFKHGIEPKWEDPTNSSGGEWRVTLPPIARKGTKLDELWINTILTVIGEGFGPEESDDIAGIVLNMRKGGDRLAIWTKSALNQDLQMRIGERWRETANIQVFTSFTSFKDVIASSNARPKPRYKIE